MGARLSTWHCVSEGNISQKACCMAGPQFDDVSIKPCHVVLPYVYMESQKKLHHRLP
jgi:hypothetical protein